MIHPTAIIHPDASIAKNADIGPYSVIGENVVIGSGVKIDSHVVVEYAEINEGCHLFSHSAIGTAPQDLKYKGEKTMLILGARTMVREYATLNRGTVAHGKTVIGSDCLIMAYCHVAHDCIVGNNVIMANAATLGGHVEVGNNAVLSSMIAIHQFTRIGKLAMIGGGSMVSMDVLPYAQAQGDRARLAGLNLVGMKRRGLPSSSIEEIKSAYRTLFMSGIIMEEAIDQLEASNPGPEVREMIEFIHSSKRGITRPLRKEIDEE